MQIIPTVTKQLLIINCIVFLASQLIPELYDWLGLHYWQASGFSFYQLLTYLFMHGGLDVQMRPDLQHGLTHLLFNMFAVWMFGSVMERTWGPKRFLIYYLVCGIGAGVLQEISQTFFVYYGVTPPPESISQFLEISNMPPDTMLQRQLNSMSTVGASGSVFGILLAFGMTYPEERMFIIPIPFPIKAKWLVIGYAGVEIALALLNSGDGVAHVAHLGGMLFGFFLIRYWRKSANRQTSFQGWEAYSGSQSQEKSATILGKIRKWFHLDRKDEGYNKDANFRSTSNHQADWDYNAQKKRDEAEIDTILDKIRRSGYASLTAEEKKKLFDASKK
ncbi:MAG: rhomboid family intramembrane serine protease [Prevotellaceae bacterium]|nr:rhomboid family intramembrane serine protease [Prevotellaceae bacterium]